MYNQFNNKINNISILFRVRLCTINLTIEFIISVLYFMSVDIEVILDNNNKIYYTNLPTGLCTINLTIDFIISVFYFTKCLLRQRIVYFYFLCFVY